MPKFLLESNKFISGELQGKNVVEKLIRHKLCTTFAIAFFFHVAVIQSNGKTTYINAHYILVNNLLIKICI